MKPHIPRSYTLGESFTRAASLIMQRPFTLLGVSFLPWLAAVLVMLVLALPLMAPGGTRTDGGRIYVLCLTFLGVLFAWLTAAFTYSAQAKVLSAAHLEKPISIREAFDGAWKRYRTVAWTMLASGLLMAVGFILFIIPGIYAVFALGLALPIAALSTRGMSESIDRSSKLFSANSWLIVGALLMGGGVVKLGEVIVKEGTKHFALATFGATLAPCVVAPTVMVAGVLLNLFPLAVLIILYHGLEEPSY